MPIEMAFDMKSASIQAAFAAGLRKVFDSILDRYLHHPQIASSAISRLPAEKNETCRVVYDNSRDWRFVYLRFVFGIDCVQRQ